MARRRIIALVGIDGAGKSTQAKRLAAWFRAQGRPAVSFENPGGRLRLSRIARRLGRADAIDLFGRRGFPIVESAARWVMIARALAWSALAGRILVMDRYTYCQYAILRARGDRGEGVVRAAYAVFPRPDLVLFLAASPEQAQRRIERRGTDSEAPGYLAALDAAYRSLPEAPSFVMIDADQPPDKVQAAIRSAVERRLLAEDRRTSRRTSR